MKHLLLKLLMLLIWQLHEQAAVGSPMTKRELQLLEMLQSMSTADESEMLSADQLQAAASIPYDDSLADLTNEYGSQDEDYSLYYEPSLEQSVEHESQDYGQAPCPSPPAEAPVSNVQPVMAMQQPCIMPIIYLHAPLVQQQQQKQPCNNLSSADAAAAATVTTTTTTKKPKSKKCLEKLAKAKAAAVAAAARAAAAAKAVATDATTAATTHSTTTTTGTSSSTTTATSTTKAVAVSASTTQAEPINSRASLANEHIAERASSTTGATTVSVAPTTSATTMLSSTTTTTTEKTANSVSTATQLPDKQSSSQPQDSKQPTSGQPNSKQPRAEQPDSKQPTYLQPTSKQSDFEQPNSKQLPVEQSASEQPNSKQLPVEQSASEQPNSKQLPAEQSASQQPNSKQLPAEQSASEQLYSKQPISEQLNYKQPKSSFRSSISQRRRLNRQRKTNKSSVPDQPKIKLDGSTQASEVIQIVLTSERPNEMIGSAVSLPTASNTSNTAIATNNKETTTTGMAATSNNETITEIATETEMSALDTECDEEDEDEEAATTEACMDNAEEETILCPQFAAPAVGSAARSRSSLRQRKPVKNYVEPILREGNFAKPRQRVGLQRPQQRDYFISNSKIVPRPTPRYRERVPPSIYMNNIVRGLHCRDERQHSRAQHARRPAAQQNYRVVQQMPQRPQLPQLPQLPLLGQPLSRSSRPQPTRSPIFNIDSAEPSDERYFDADAADIVNNDASLDWTQELLHAPPSIDPCQAEHSRAADNANANNYDYQQSAPNYFT